MSDDFKCPEGWELSDHSFHVFQDNYEYKVIRRKKQKPMPEILPGYAVTMRQGNGLWHVVSRIHKGCVESVSRLGRLEFAMVVADVIAIRDRDGLMIWERER